MRSLRKPDKMFLLKFYCKMFLYLGVPGSPDPSNNFLGVVDFGRPVPTARESGTGLGTMETISKSSSSSRCYRGCQCCGGTIFLVHEVVMIPRRVTDFRPEASRRVTGGPGSNGGQGVGHVRHFYIM